MSGLAGCVSQGGARLDVGLLRRMAESTPHVSVEGLTSWCSGPAALVRFHRAATPQAVDDDQPLTDDAEGVTVCLDGRIDNRDELLAGLSDTPLDREPSDCAILLALFKRFGADCLRRLVGDYVLAVWCARTRQMLCGRSPLGWRRLVWCRQGPVVAFATEAKTLVDGLPLRRRLNEGAIAEYLSMRFTTQTDTFWADVFRLPPGSAMLVDRDDFSSKRCTLAHRITTSRGWSTTLDRRFEAKLQLPVRLQHFEKKANP